MVPLPETLLTTATPAAKLRPPRVRHAELWRQRILDQDRVTRAEIVAVIAPAGFGKSTLAAQWAARSQRPLVWLTCDQTDADPLVLMADLRAALSQGVPGYRPSADLLTLEEPAYSRVVLPGFLRSVDELGPVTVVLDNAHFACADLAGRVLESFVDVLPEESQVALVGRSLPGLPLPLWRGQGRVADVGVDDLSFSTEETRAALGHLTDELVGDDLVQRVQQATDGWPVAVYLSSRAGTDVRPVSTIDELIETEVLDPMPGALRAFVTQTAALGVVNADLAAAATGQHRAVRFLAETTSTVLVRTTDDDWYHYHPLMRECATRRLARDDPETLRRVRAAAALWHLDQGHLEQAVQFALAAGDRPVLGTVLWPAARISLLQGRTPTVQAWLAEASEQAILQTPQLGMTAAWTSLVVSDFGNVLRFAEATLRRMPNDWRSHLASSDIGPHLAMLLAVTGLGVADQREATALSLAAAESIPDDDPTVALARLIAGLNLALAGDPDALPAMVRAAAVATSSGIPSTTVESQALTGLLQMVSGDDTAGCDAVEAAQTAFAFHDLARMTSTTGILALARVALCSIRGRRDEARAAIDELNRITPLLETIFPWYRPLAGAVMAFADVRLGDFAAFQRHAAWCEQSPPVPGGLCQQWLGRARAEYAASSPLRDLSPAELRVWELLKGRMTLSEIAGALFLSRETVKTHTVAIYRKLGVSSRRQAQDLADTWG